MTKTISEIRNFLEKLSQSHVFKYWDTLSKEKQNQLTNQLRSIDFDVLERAQNQIKDNESNSEDNVEIEQIPKSIKGVYNELSIDDRTHLFDVGLKAIFEGKVAVITLAGGQGTRLNSILPKGIYNLGLLSGKTLFQLQAEKLIKIKESASLNHDGFCKGLPWYIMTSEHTLNATRNFFIAHNYFNYPEDDVIFFEQNDLPALLLNGKIAMKETWQVGTAPDGNGGLFSVLASKYMLQDMLERGVTCVHVYCVDNILVRIADPLFIGFSLENNADCSVKVVKKVEPNESVGVVCKFGSSYKIVEYSEISKELAELRDSQTGDLVFRDGNICNHFFTREFLEDVSKKYGEKMKFHIALKKMKCINMESGELVEPMKPNVIKFEKFIFDVIPFSRRFYIWEVDRSNEFSPLKQEGPSGKDTPLTCRKDLESLHRKWLGYNDGNDCIINGQESERSTVEISPLVSYGGEGLDQLTKIPKYSTIEIVDGNLLIQTLDQ